MCVTLFNQIKLFIESSAMLKQKFYNCIEGGTDQKKIEIQRNCKRMDTKKNPANSHASVKTLLRKNEIKLKTRVIRKTTN